MFSFSGRHDYPYWRLSAFYLFYYACLGAWIPYWPLYLQHIGHSALVIGITSAVFHSTRIIAPNLWGYLSDKTGRRLGIIRLGCFWAFITIAGMNLGTNVWLLTTVLFLFSFFWSAVLPQFEVLTLDFLGPKRAHNYGRVRLWGSIGFILAVFVCGWIFGIWPLSLFPWVICAVLFLLWLSSMVIPVTDDKAEEKAPETEQNFLQIARRYHVWGYLLAVILMQISFGPYYNFFSILLKDNNYPLIAVSLFWCVAITAEVLVFNYMRPIYARFGVKPVLYASILLGVLRWVMTGAFAGNVWIMVLAQVLHAFSFATFHACMIELIRHIFPANQHGKGQAMFNSLGYGLGAVLGALGSGLLWGYIGHMTFYVAALAAVLSFVFAYYAVCNLDFDSSEISEHEPPKDV